MTEPREGHWTAKPLRTRWPFIYYQGIVTIAYLAAMAEYLWTHPHPHGLPTWISALNGFGFLVLGSFYTINEFRCLRATKTDLASAERPEGLPEFLVEISFTHAMRNLGRDRGVLYFDRGLVGFVGGRTSFLLAAEDLDVPQVRPPLDFDIPLKPLVFRAGARQGTITIKPLLGYGGRYRTRMRQFLRDREPTEAERQWPPLLPYQGLPRLEAPI